MSVEYEIDPNAQGVEYQVTKVDPTDPGTKGMVYQVHKVDEVTASMSGKFYRARIIKDPSDPTVRGKVYQIVIIDDPDDPSVKGKVFNAIVTGDQEVVVVGPAVPPLDLSDAVADTLTSLKAFGGTEQGGVPSGYTAVEYVENATDGMVKSAIHIGNEDNFKMDITATVVSGSFYLFQARDVVGQNYGNATICGISGSQNGGTIIAGSGGSNSLTSGITRPNRDGHKLNIVFDCTDGDMSLYVKDIDGNVSDTKTGTYNPAELTRPTTNMCIYGNEAPTISSALPKNRLAAGCKVYGAKLWKNGVLVLDYVPAIRNSDSAIGFYDRISGTFVIAADGSLTAGSSLAPTPSDPMDIYCNNGALKILDKSDWTIFTNPTSIAGQGVFISSDGKWYAVNDRGAGCAIPLTIGKQYTLVIHKKTATLGTILRYGQSPQGTPTLAGIQLTDWYRGEITDGQMISFVAKQAYFVMQFSSVAVEAGMVQEAIEVIEAAGDNETIAIRTRNLANVATDIDGKYIGVDGSIGTNASSCYSDIIPVVAGETYVWSCICGNSGTSNNKRVHAYVDGVWQEQIWLAEVSAGVAWSKSFTVPAGCNGIRISHWNTDTETQVELGSTKTAYIAYNDSTATANNLFAINTYKDVQEIITGATTHNLGIRVFDGTEDWTFATGGNAPARLSLNNLIKGFPNTDVAPFVCSHFIPAAWNDISIASRTTPYIIISSTQTPFVAFTVGWDNTITDLDSWKAFLATQYAAGTPVIMVFLLATPFEEPAPIAQSMTVVDGDNTVSLTQQGMTPLELEATYTQQQ